MRRRRGLGSAIVGLTLGLVLGFLMLNYRIVTSKTSTLQRPAATVASTREEMQGTRDVSDENSHMRDSSKSLVFVGVMTAHKYLGTRAKAVYETWGKNLPGKIAFFSSEFSTVPENCPDLPLVALPRVDDGYPPQKKSFLMLQYMWKNFGNRYEWFLRADDDVYVRTDRLEKLLRSVDSRKAMYIGQAGRGNSEEFGLLSLEYDENFCMGGPGVIMSRETLKRIVPHIKYCLKNLYTTHEDVELGRCVQKYAGIPCTWSYEIARSVKEIADNPEVLFFIAVIFTGKKREVFIPDFTKAMQSILYHNSSGDQAFTGSLKRKEVHRAITLHPVKSPPHMYRLDNYIRGLQIQDLQQERVRLHRDVSVMAEQLGTSVNDFKKRPLAKDVQLFPGKLETEDYTGDSEVLGVPAGLRGFKPRKSQEVIPWDFYSRSEYSLADSNPRRRIHSDIKEGLEDITREVMASINSCSRQRGRIVEERSALYGYRRVDAYGADTILDLLLVYRKYRGRKVTLPVRRHVYLHQHFTGLEIREVVDCEEVDQRQHQENSERSLQSIFRNGFLSFNSQNADPVQSKTIKFILPLSGRLAILERFLKNYEEICLSTLERTKLVVVLYRHRTEQSYEHAIALINELSYRHSNAKIEIVRGSGNFSRARALELGISESRDDELLFFVDVDIVFTASALSRIRLNTVLNRRIYFPVVFSQFDPRVVYGEATSHENFVIDERTGYWREFGFGIASIYKQDYRSIGGFDLLINGWGKEDVDLYEKAVRSDLDVFRAPDKNLIHVYHEVECDVRLSGAQLAMCRGTRADTYGSTETLAHIVYGDPKYLKFAKLGRTRLRNSGQ